MHRGALTSIDPPLLREKNARQRKPATQQRRARHGSSALHSQLKNCTSHTVANNMQLHTTQPRTRLSVCIQYIYHKQRRFQIEYYKQRT